MANELRTQYRPDYVSPPGATLLDILEERGMTQNELAKRMGRTPKLINEIVKGKAPITEETALQLEHALGVPASFWNNRERAYRESLAEVREREKLVDQIGWLERFPIVEMIARGWIEKYEDQVEQMLEVLNFFGIASPNQYEICYGIQPVALRQSRAFEADENAVMTWLRKGELEAQDILCQPFDKVRFQDAIGDVKGLTRSPEINESVQIMTDICASSGVAVVLVPQLDKTRVSGATYWVSPTKAVIQLTIRYKMDDQFWFSFFHEAGHIVLEHKKKEIFINFEDASENVDEEREADIYARDILIPPEAYDALRTAIAERRGKVSRDLVRCFAEEIGVAPGIVVGRLQHDRLLDWSYLNDLKAKLQWVEVE